MDQKIKIGSAGWIDLTVPQAKEVSAFYEKVVGWSSAPVSQGTYDDYVMNSPTDGSTQVGICHDRGSNAHIPPVWMVYFYVENLEESLTQVTASGGKLIGEIRNMGNDRYALIQDPAGAHCTLYQKAV